ncbi:phosphoribosylglycinamide formyltransferase 2 [Mycobacterium montefiorense]|uniref:Phosphoribosylglycinamide formyltransferase 2 n=2 Tax=Mycobacterium montefiorense TaxID=154654 RepID=A0AA37PQI1_9MYCO|nr:phosphoribosylglycinamide formyltransferase 2 [Mycobacterium montefiorense]GKU36460.1 phosphoribosylglycinamide formyltransferase 2 [Mycobacterium montefiorense]GKU39388.1 phosphoribosylglycinamide formyltransferase 2 [Mycobacterium montefiorense]GKU44621.1 phosphoribosylglycinamide formyltransferase 2 [Mycobacterium montefiorense]GKU54007.1 phosphoribosylglycinamide formyltransferase 2 [Mycobacterium montefiorense]
MTDGVTERQRETSHGARVMLLGSGEFSRELAIALRRLGAKVEEHSDATAGDLAGAIDRLQPDFVVTATRAVSVAALEALAARSESDGAVELVPNARTVRLTNDREGLRRLAADQLGLPTAPFWFVGSVGELKAVAAHGGYPLLVESLGGTAGRSVVSGPDDVEPAWRRAVGQAEQQRVLAETEVEVEFYVTLLAIRSEGAGGPVIEFCSPIGHRRAEPEVLESWQPQKMSPAALDAAKSIAARILKALGGRGVFAVELMINGDEVHFADVSAVLPQSAWVTLRSQRLSAVELQARAILGLPVDALMISPAAARTIHPAPTAEALTAALAVGESDLRVFEPGPGPRRGIALATAPDVAAARDRAREVATAVSRGRQL